MSTYVYGVVADSHPLDLAQAPAVGAAEEGTRVLTAAGLAAVVSTAPEELRAKRRYLLAHQRVLDLLGEQGTVLPMRFGTVAPDDEAVAERLHHEAGHYASLLEHLHGRVELNVKAEHHEEAVLREVLRHRSDLAARNEELCARGGGTLQERMGFGEAMAQAVEEQRRSDTERVVEALAGHARQWHRGPSTGTAFCNLSLLVDRERVPEVQAAVADLQESLSELMELRLNGPLVPYSFVGEASPAEREEV